MMNPHASDESSITVKQIATKPLSRPMRILLVIAGHIFVALGVIGAILPLMPTTIFLILAGWCYARSSERFHCWLYTNKFFGTYLRNYKENRGTPLSVKIGSISVLWISIGISIWTTTMPWFVPWILIGIASAVTVHLARLKTLKKESSHES
ncbi:YbaN family protein [bacterium]|nr:YbaN family protein [bacterium]